MSLEVLFSPRALAPVDLAGRTVMVIDILRATTTMCAAIHHGARAIIPTDSPDEAHAIARRIGTDAVLAGERNALPIPGFDLGNSPREMVPDRVRDKTVVLCTTNGTGALLSAQSAKAIYPGAACNLSLLAALGRATLDAEGSLLILCAGRAGTFGLDDAYCAGRLVTAVVEQAHLGVQDLLGDGAHAAVEIARGFGPRWDIPLRLSMAGQDLQRLGFGADIDFAAREDVFPSLIRFHDGQVARQADTP
jgi:2-phosphosulfolactate phosphatase